MVAKPKRAVRRQKSAVSKKRRKPAKVAAKPAAKPRRKAAPARRPKPEARGPEQLGTISVPSGQLAIFDVGLVGYLPREALEPQLVTCEVPKSRELPVVGTRVGKGRYGDCWDHVAVKLGSGEVASSRKLGEAGVDFARLVCMDRDALDHWQHEDSLDGRADFVFWGRDADQLATAMRAPETPEGHGWIDLSVADAEAKALEAERLKAEHHWLLATDFRPHSHHFHALAAARKSKLGAGTIEVGGAKVCLFFTTWGDGVFPIFVDLDGANRPVQVRVQLAAAT